MAIENAMNWVLLTVLSWGRRCLETTSKCHPGGKLSRSELNTNAKLRISACKINTIHDCNGRSQNPTPSTKRNQSFIIVRTMVTQKTPLILALVTRKPLIPGKAKSQGLFSWASQARPTGC
jgi:hypothetical protein